MLKKPAKRYRRHKRVRAKIIGTAQVPRLCIFRSNKYIYGQLIDDNKGKTLLSVSDKEIKKPKQKLEKKKPASAKATAGKEEKDIIRTGKVAVAYEVGKLLAEKALKNKVKKIVFDRGGYKYHGRVKAVAEGARDAGLIF